MARWAAMAGLLAASVLLATGAAGGGRVYPSPEAVEPLEPGSPVPTVRFRALSGEEVALSKLLQERGATLVFYRGGW